MRATSSASVTRSRMRRVSSSTPTQTSCRMQWPSQWSGCSASDDLRALDRGDDVGERDLVGRAGEHVAAADAPLRAHEPGALHRQAGSARGTAAAGACARRSPSPRSVGPCRGARATAAPGRRSRRASTSSCPHRRADGAVAATPRPRSTLRADDLSLAGPLAGAVRPALDGASVAGLVPALLGGRRRRLAARAGARRPTRWCCSCSTVSGWNALREHAADMPELAAMEGGADHDRRARDDRVRAHLDRDRARARAARHPRLPHARRRARC